MKKIIVDTLGSDKGPSEVIKGAKLTLDAHKDVSVILVGDEELIKNSDLPMDRVTIIDSKETITNNDNPIQAFYKADKVSIFQALKEASNNDEVIGVITSGSTGAMMVGSIKYLLDENRTRPALAVCLPTLDKERYICIVDIGASIDCESTQLVNFAHLGSDFMKKLYNIESPLVGLLSNGTERGKGNKVVKETHEILLKEEGINFVGNIEAKDVFTNKCDVLVCDGFVGNQVLKNIEGTATTLITEMMKWGHKTNNLELVQQLAGSILKKYDLQNGGAAILLGAKKIVMKAHGSCDAQGIESAAKMLINIANNEGNIYNF